MKFLEAIAGVLLCAIFGVVVLCLAGCAILALALQAILHLLAASLMVIGWVGTYGAPLCRYFALALNDRQRSWGAILTRIQQEITGGGSPSNLGDLPPCQQIPRNHDDEPR